jgi:hypothetical protein
MIVGIDLALRKTGIVALDNKGNLKEFSIVSSDPKTVTGEDLLIHNRKHISANVMFCLATKGKTQIALEGLSFNSVSADHDLISANHWITRLTLKDFSSVNLSIFPPKSWQKSIVTKDVMAEWLKEYPVIRAKKGKKLTKEEVAANSKSKLAIRKLSKQLILEAVPGPILKKFEMYVTQEKLPKDAIYDLTDAYCLAMHLKAQSEQ